MKTTPTKRSWYFERQQHRCSLFETEQCRRRKGVMTPNIGQEGASATWDHVLPDMTRPKGATPLLMLACFDCNNAKGSKWPQPKHVDAAREMARVWFEWRDECHKLSRAPPVKSGTQCMTEIDAQVSHYRVMIVPRLHRPFSAKLGEAFPAPLTRK